MRKDFYIYNEANGFCLHSKGIGGLSRSDLLQDLPGKVNEGLVIPVELIQDDSFHIGVVMGNLTEEEEEQWVGKLAWKLRIPDGSLTDRILDFCPPPILAKKNPPGKNFIPLFQLSGIFCR